MLLRRRCGLALTALASLCGCLDWDALRATNEPPDGADTPPGPDAGAGDTDRTIVSWVFAGTGDAVSIPDQASALPDALLRRRDASGSASLANGELVLDDATLTASAEETRALGAALVGSREGFSAEVWVVLMPEIPDDSSFFASTVGGFAFVHSNQEIGASVAVANDELFLAPANPAPTQGLHHLVLTYASDAGHARLYLDGQPVAEGNVAEETPMVWPAGDASAENVVRVGAPEWHGRVASAALFARALDPSAVSARFVAGPR